MADKGLQVSWKWPDEPSDGIEGFVIGMHITSAMEYADGPFRPGLPPSPKRGFWRRLVDASRAFWWEFRAL